MPDGKYRGLSRGKWQRRTAAPTLTLTVPWERACPAIASAKIHAALARCPSRTTCAKRRNPSSNCPGATWLKFSRKCP